MPTLFTIVKLSLYTDLYVDFITSETFHQNKNHTKIKPVWQFFGYNGPIS